MAFQFMLGFLSIFLGMSKLEKKIIDIEKKKPTKKPKKVKKP